MLQSNMLKNLTISMKLALGFGIILVLTTAVAYVGWSGLSGTTAIVEKADDANRLIKQSLNARLEQKNFMAEKDDLRWRQFDGHFECLGFAGEATSSVGSEYRCLFSSVPVWYHHR